MKIFSKRSLEGYLEIDHSQSPGINVNQAVSMGMDIAVPGGSVFKSATMMCSKCQVQIILNPDRSRSRGHCRGCDHDICDGCSLLLKLGHDCSPNNCWHKRLLNI